MKLGSLSENAVTKEAAKSPSVTVSSQGMKIKSGVKAGNLYFSIY